MTNEQNRICECCGEPAPEGHGFYITFHAEHMAKVGFADVHRAPLCADCGSIGPVGSPEIKALADRIRARRSAQPEAKGPSAEWFAAAQALMAAYPSIEAVLFGVGRERVDYSAFMWPIVAGEICSNMTIKAPVLCERATNDPPRDGHRVFTRAELLALAGKPATYIDPSGTERLIGKRVESRDTIPAPPRYDWEDFAARHPGYDTAAVAYICDPSIPRRPVCPYCGERGTDLLLDKCTACGITAKAIRKRKTRASQPDPYTLTRTGREKDEAHIYARMVEYDEKQIAALSPSERRRRERATELRRELPNAALRTWPEQFSSATYED